MPLASGLHSSQCHIRLPRASGPRPQVSAPIPRPILLASFRPEWVHWRRVLGQNRHRASERSVRQEWEHSYRRPVSARRRLRKRWLRVCIPTSRCRSPRVLVQMNPMPASWSLTSSHPCLHPLRTQVFETLPQRRHPLQGFWLQTAMLASVTQIRMPFDCHHTD